MTKKSEIPTALVAPLDWGLGHTTRCIPVIYQLQQHGYKVIVAAEAVQATLLLQEFPQITIIPLQGYRIQYSQHKRWLAFKILQQLPKIIYAIWHEHHWLKKQADLYQFQLIISDNRFGLWHKKVTSIFITHQLAIQTPFKWLSNIVGLVNYFYINRYHTCWVPDMQNTHFSIAGHLSHPNRLPKTPVSYVGPLSRFAGNTDTTPRETAAFTYKWLFILSGPEPQRSLLEIKLLEAVSHIKERVLLLRAKPGATDLPAAPSNCKVINHLPSNEMEKVIRESEYVISRSGYTTIMELLALQKKALLIPTPGQTEQEYLANRLQQLKWCYSCTQEDDVLKYISQAYSFTYQLPEPQQQLLKNAIAAL